MNSSNRSTKEDIDKWLKPTLDKEKFKEYTISVTGSTEKGDGYLGDISFVDVYGKTDEDEEKILNFVIKSGKKSKQLREMMPIKTAFETEMYVYNEILPAFKAFQKEKGIADIFDNTPKCYGTENFKDMEVLILENMKKNGFYLWDRTKPMDSEHIKTVIRTYGKYHAISFALRDQKPEVFKKLTTNLKDVLKMMMENIKQPEEGSTFQDMVLIAKEKQESLILEKLLELRKETKALVDLTDPSDPYAVIVHGDCWNNNFMFKKDDNQNLKVCLLDFQISKLASPVYDLSYFLFTCISEDDAKNFHQIIGIYYDSFSNFTKQLGSDPNKVFPFEELLNQWKKYSKFGLIMMPNIVKICLSDKEDVSDLAEAADAGVEIQDAFAYKVRKTEEYEKRTFPVMRLAIEKHFI